VAQIYDKPVRLLIKDMIREIGLKPSQPLERDQIVAWFAERYPKIKEGTIHAHLARMSVNVPSRIHYSPIVGDDDVFYRLDPSRYRLYEPASDPAPIRKGEVRREDDGLAPEPEEALGTEFAYERDLRNFLSKNLHVLEVGLKLFEDEGITGVEFPAGGRFIDILAVDKSGSYVVIELKVSRGYDRTVGQVLRYMGWVERHQADPGQKVRGIIVAKEMSEDLLLAVARVPDIELYEYQLSVSLHRVLPAAGHAI
jgi:hypothetical protein